MGIERIAAVEDRTPDRLDPLVKLHRPAVEIAPQTFLEIDAEIRQVARAAGGRDGLRSHRLTLRTCRQRHLWRLPSPRAGESAGARPGDVPAEAVDHEVADEELLRRLFAGIVDRFTLELHTSATGDPGHLGLLAAAWRLARRKLERPVEDHIEGSRLEFGRRPLRDHRVDEPRLLAVEVEPALPGDVELAGLTLRRGRRRAACHAERLECPSPGGHRQRQPSGTVDGEPVMAAVKLDHRPFEIEAPPLHHGRPTRNDRLGVGPRRPRELHLVAANLHARLGHGPRCRRREWLLDEVHLPLHRHLVHFVAGVGKRHLSADERGAGDHLSTFSRRGDLCRRQGCRGGRSWWRRLARGWCRGGSGCDSLHGRRRVDGPEPEFEPVGPRRDLLGISLNHATGEQPRRPNAGEIGTCGGVGLRGPLPLHHIEPEVHLGGRQPALRLDGHIGIAGQRHDVPVAVGPHPEPLLPPSLCRRRLLRTHADPAGPHGHERPRVAGFAGHVVDLSGLHLRPLCDERHRLFTIEQDSPRGDLVAEPGGTGLELRPGRAGHDGRAFCLNLHRLEASAGMRGRTSARPLRLTGQHDREQVARELLGGAIGCGPDHIHVILERDHVGRGIHAQRAAARDEHRWRGGWAFG